MRLLQSDGSRYLITVILTIIPHGIVEGYSVPYPSPQCSTGLLLTPTQDAGGGPPRPAIDLLAGMAHRARETVEQLRAGG